MSLPKTKYCGVVVPMISPFTPAGAIDEPAVGRIVEVLIGGGVGGVFPLGTTGEDAGVRLRSTLTARLGTAISRLLATSERNSHTMRAARHSPFAQKIDRSVVTESGTTYDRFTHQPLVRLHTQRV